jgi:hypothetical protein
MSDQPGRFCPSHYHYGARALAAPPAFSSDTLLVAGGLYGNPEALTALENLAAPDGADLVFNGDFHWFDSEPGMFDATQRRVLAHRAIAGNVEAELAEPSGAGCGCGYPPRVDDTAVSQANMIMQQLQGTAMPAQREQLARLAYHATAEVGGYRIALIHGDPDSLAGWGLDVNALGSGSDTSEEQLRSWFRQAGADVFACSHTCLPHTRTLEVDGRRRAIINNGAAGMPNFRGDHRGVVTRIATTSSPHALYRARLNGLAIEAIALDYDLDTWIERFERWWPPGSPAHRAYYERLTQGPGFELAQALGPGAQAV